MPAKPTPVASQRIADVLAARILAGELPPGARIKQDELAAEFAASRIPVREALRILQSRGLVALRANSGAWVTQMSLHDLSISYRIRERVEPLLLQEAMRSTSASDIAELRDLQARIEAGGDVEEFLVLDRELHWATYRNHQAPELAAIVERLWDTTQHYRRAFTRLTRSHGAWNVNAEHRLLIDAIADDDSQTATSLLETHIRRTRFELTRHPELFEG